MPHRLAVPAAAACVALAVSIGCESRGGTVPGAGPEAEPLTVAEAAAAKLAALKADAGLPDRLADARRGFASDLLPPGPAEPPPPVPPPGAFELVTYRSPVGPLPAYLSTHPSDDGADGRRPGIVWVGGGDSASLGAVWEPAPPENDQTAAAFPAAGIVTLYPSLRGGHGNPGRREGFLGEVDDVLAAAAFLKARSDVDPGRVHLGGHSTGGTLAMLAAAAAEPGTFRATFAFGPVADVRGYGGDFLYHRDPDDDREALVRSPLYWLADVPDPLFAIEGAGTPGNADSLDAMRQLNGNPRVRFLTVPGRDHFDVLAPATAAIADAILADDGPTCDIALTPEMLGGA